MKRNLALLVAMAAAAFAQTPTVVGKPEAKASSQTVKVAPVSAGKSAKPSPTTGKVATTPTPKAALKPAVVSVKPATHANVATTAKTIAVPAAKPAVVATPAKAVAVVAPKLNVASSSKQTDKTAKAAPVVVKTKGSTISPGPAVAAKVPVKPRGKQSATSTKPKGTVAVQDKKSSEDKKQPVKTFNAVSRRDPFVSPVVNLGAVGSGCSSGKRCLAIDQIALKGVVRSESGMIAVVVNAMDKAYFLRENDPVFNGYVTKITGDSIVFKETFKDRLGKSLTRDITKTIRRPVA